MPDISLFEPTVLQGVVEKFTAPADLVMLNRLPRRPWPYPTITWDIIQGSKLTASPNVPNSAAHIVPRLGRGQQSASFIYVREKKVFEPTTLYWVRTPGELAQTNAEAAVLREVQDLNQRFDIYAETLIWQALQGGIAINTLEVVANVDYQFQATHTSDATWGGTATGANWSTATPAQMIAEIRAIKRLIVRDSRVRAREVFLTEPTMAYIFESFSASADAAALLSDRMKDAYYQTGEMSGFMGLNWMVTEGVYDTSAVNDTLFVADNEIYVGNFTDNTPIYLAEGPTADHSAPQGMTGKFAKTWLEEDPSGRQHLLEWHMLPIIERPEQLYYRAAVNT